MIGGLPNIYTFTKRLAEIIVNDSRHEIPVIIGRPSVGKNPIKYSLIQVVKHQEDGK